MKDYFDLFILLGEDTLNLGLVRTATERTFERRKTITPRNVPIGLSEEFGTDRGKIAQWKAFLSKNSLSAPPLDHTMRRDLWDRLPATPRSLFPDPR